MRNLNEFLPLSPLGAAGLFRKDKRKRDLLWRSCTKADHEILILWLKTVSNNREGKSTVSKNRNFDPENLTPEDKTKLVKQMKGVFYDEDADWGDVEVQTPGAIEKK